jgi:hypothetical protein
MIQTDNDEVAVGLNTRTVQELPVLDRNHQELVNLQPGVTPPAVRFPLTQGPSRQREWNTNGQAYYANRQGLEGVTNYEPMRATAVRVVPDEAVQQFNVASANYGADQGFAAGSLSQIVTRPGTNGWHGSLFEFHRNNALVARSPFDTTGDTPRLTYNQFGGTIGGPIVRDRFFFFGSYEGSYNRGENTTIATVPTDAMRAGNFSGIPGITIFNPATGTAAGLNRTAFVNNTIPAVSMNSTARAFLPFIPLANQPGLANNFVANVPYANDWQKFDGRIDGHFTEATHGFLRYGYTNAHATQNSIFGAALGNGDANRVVGQNAVAGISHAHGNLSGDLRFGYNRYEMNQFPMGSQALIGSALGVAAAPDQFLPSFNVGGTLSLGSLATSPQRGVDNSFNWNTGWTWHTSMHNIKFGADIQHYRTDGFNNLYFGSLGTEVFGPGATLSASMNPALFGSANLFPNTFAAFLLGTPSASGTTFFNGTPTARQTWYSGWVGDTINLYRIVTLDLGVRYEVYSPITPRHAGGAQVFNPATNSLNTIGANGLNVQDYDLNNVAPRVGVAVRITPKTVLRGGWGMNYYQLPVMLSGYMPATFGTFQGAAGGFTTVAPFNASTFPGLLATPSPAAGTIPPNGPLNVLLNNTAEIPYVQHFNAQLQQEFGDGIVLGIGYQGELGRHLPYHYELNQGLPGTGLAGLPLMGIGRTASTMAYTYGLTSNYNALQINLTKRMGHGLQFQGAYTWSKALGYTTESGLLQNPSNLRSNYGPADYDRQHMLTIAHVWDLPFGTGTQHMNHGMVGQILGNWAINGVFTWASGTPFNVFADPLFFGGPNGTVFANVNGQVQITDQRGPNQAFFNTSAFAPPAAGSFSNQPRNFLRGPGFRNYNLSLFKTFAFMERYKFEIRGEAYNLTNSPHFTNPQVQLNSGEFGTITNVGNGLDALGRQIDIALRLIF